MKKIVLILFLSLLISGCSMKNDDLGARVDTLWTMIAGKIYPSHTGATAFIVPGATGLIGSTTATLYADIAKETVFMKNTSIGSLTLSSAILTPLKIRYAAGSATSSLISESKAGNLSISAASSTYPNQLVLTNGGMVSVGNSTPSAWLGVLSNAVGTSDLFRIGSSSSGDKLVVNKKGNVGIGTTNPLQPLHVSGSVVGDVIARVENTSIGANASAKLELKNDAGTLGGFFIGGTGFTGYVGTTMIFGGNAINFMSNNTVASGGTGAIRFIAGGYNVSPQLTILGDGSGGNVGIGTTTPASVLHVYRTANTDDWGMIFTNKSGVARDTGIRIGRNTVNSAGIKTVTVGTNLDYLGFNMNGTGVTAFGDTAQLVLQETGNVGIGTTNPSLGKLEITSAATMTGGFAMWRGSGFGTSIRQWIDSNDVFIMHRSSFMDYGLVISSNGLIGIGTTTPINLLQVGRDKKTGVISTSTIMLGNVDSGSASTTPACFVAVDSDGAGYTYIRYLDGAEIINQDPCN